MTKQRESSFELLRIISILMIVIMHCMAPLLNTHNTINQEVLLSINAIANTGVSLFILISGYFGVKFRLERLLSIIGIVFFYAILSFFVDKYILDILFLPKDYLPYFFPLMCKKYWFITCYVIVYCLSPWLNRILDNLAQQDLKRMLTVLLIFFWIVPTFMVFYEIMDDGGKGLINMIVLYLTGRYIKTYGFPHFIKKYSVTLIIGCVLFMILSNTGLSVALKSVNMRFCRDNSIFILLESLAIFYLFAKMSFKNKVVNYFAGFAFPLYLVNIIALEIKYHFYPIDINSLNVWGEITINILFVLLCSICVEILRRLTFGQIPLHSFGKISGAVHGSLYHFFG